MKMFKKLMAVALAGVMALTVLTGCAGTINKKEYVNVLNDLIKVSGKDYTVEQGSDKLAKEVLAKVEVYAENHNRGERYTKTAVAYEVLQNLNHRDPADIKAIVPKDAKDQYSLMWTQLNDYESKAFKNNESAANVIRMAMGNECELNEVDEDKLGTTATASIATQKIGEATFLVIVLVQAAK
ncbi:hypothetical protein [Faecalibacterium hattorii]|uniref:hypothetical protein n=1 Tax=Faecalibacterium hattorii TaxID=2935520 RepID=UPI003AAF1253